MVYAAGRPVTVQKSAMDKKKPHILIVDDEERNLRLITAFLAPFDYDIFTARSGQDALEKVRQSPPDLILLDIMMPGMDGFEVARRLKGQENTSIIPVVMVTSLNDAKDRIMALEAGVDDFLSKPVDKSELTARVRSLLKVKKYNDHMQNYRKELESQVETRTQQLASALQEVKAASLETIYKLSRASEYKDTDTGEHIQRMSRYAAAVTKAMGKAEADIQSILYASPMHDIGKIGIPDRILLKPGKLDADEWEIMKAHTIIGAKILAGSDAEYIQLAQMVALTHHEKWDGSGYPRGLIGSDIPFAGRITAIADVFDALTSKRPYKEPFSVEKSFDIIKSSRGSHFDPEVVDAFFSVIGDILSIKEQFKDGQERLG